MNIINTFHPHFMYLLQVFSVSCVLHYSEEMARVCSLTGIWKIWNFLAGMW